MKSMVSVKAPQADRKGKQPDRYDEAQQDRHVIPHFVAVRDLHHADGAQHAHLARIGKKNSI